MKDISNIKTSPFAKNLAEEDAYKNIHPVNGVLVASTNIGLYKHKEDLAVFVFKNSASVAGVFTKSTTASETVCRSKKLIQNKYASGLIVNSGNSNTFTGEGGVNLIQQSASSLAKLIGKPDDSVFVCSTGVIGVLFDYTLITNNMQSVVQNLSNTQEAYKKAAVAILTTDTYPKIFSVKTTIKESEITITGIAKGSGMIEPNMATMLCYIFTDADISPPILQDILNDLIDSTFNSITVDSDTSTSDTLLLFATNAAQNQRPISKDDPIIDKFKQSLHSVMLNLAKMVVKDGEGVSKFITIKINEAENNIEANKIAKSIANSPLVKTAIAGQDPNWGRVIMAIGKAQAKYSKDNLFVKFGDIIVLQNGQLHQSYSDDKLSQYLKNREITIEVSLGVGNGLATVYTTDLTSDYIKINASYKS